MTQSQSAPASRPAPECVARSQPRLDDHGRARTLQLTTSSVGSYLGCPKRYQWAYELGLRREQSSAALGIGSAYHAALEAINHGTPIAAAAALARSPLIADEIDREIAACMVSGWAWRWSDAPQFAKILEVERVFEFETAGVTIMGKIDVIGELPDSRVAVGEYKTTSEDISPGSDYWRRLLIDRQCSTYVMAARSMGYNVDTVCFDAARKPGLRPRLLSRKKDGDGAREDTATFAARLMESIAEKPDWYYRREEIPRVDADLELWKEDMSHVATLIGFSRTLNRWPRNTDSCKRWGTCPYFGPCVANHDLETQGTPSGFVRVENVHVELTRGGGSLSEADNDCNANE